MRYWRFTICLVKFSENSAASWYDDINFILKLLIIDAIIPYLSVR